jgi:flavodoxin
VKAAKTILIVSDGTESASKMAEAIASALKGNKVTVKKAEDFTGTDLLPADSFFIGCEKPKPQSFGYLAELLQHINLVGRTCGVFSSADSGSEKAVKYLTGLLKDCEAALNQKPLLAEDASTVSAWAESVITNNF